jgi:outer membrane protein OmpA-like peptidoglycan-associated protein
MSVVLDGSLAFFSRGNPESKDIDIYQVEIHDLYKPSLATFVKIKILNKDTRVGISTLISIEGLDGQFPKKNYLSDQKGEALICILAQDKYSLRIQKKGYDLFTENIQFDSIATFVEPLEYTVGLSHQTSWKDHNPVVLKNIFFEFGKADLLSESLGEIQFLAEFLVTNHKIKIEIIGHTDNIGSQERNLELSVARAKSVKNKLVESGIAEERVSAKGKGDQNPIASNDSEHGRAQNRRTEFRIIP